jgi:two-component system, NarL family, sensor histidine kinase YdfH
MYNKVMEKIRRWVATLREWFGFQEMHAPDVREARFFFVIVTLVLGGAAAMAIRSMPALRAQARLIPFTALMLVHIALYWLSPAFMKSQRRIVIYLVMQAALIFVITLFPRDFSIVLSLYPALLGIAVGMLPEKRQVILIVVIWLGLVTGNLLLIQGRDILWTWLLYAPPLTLFVVIYVVLYTRQVEARDRAQRLLRELEIAHAELAEHAERIAALTLAAERQRMARELHDTLAQGLAGLLLQLEAADSHLDAGRGERAQGIVQQAMARARATLAEARRAIDDLRATQLSAPDLADAIRDEAAHFSAATGIPCALDLALPDALPTALCGHALRAVAEGLTNVARHAQAQQVWIRAAEAEEWLTIEVRDDGAGFDPEAALSRTGHYGLLGLRERARLAGGTLEIDSAPGEGARLSLRLPL